MNEAASDLFGFVDSSEIKDNLEGDLHYLHLCIQSKANKPAIIMIGSLIESALYYHIDTSEELKAKIENFDKRNVHLSDLLGWAKQFGIIDEGMYKLADPIRDYRNLIHPRVQARLGNQVSDLIVQIGYNVLLEIIRSVNRHANSLNSKKAINIVREAIEDIHRRKPNDADLKIYVPIIEKYGFDRGKLIIERSLKFSKQRRSKR